ncbi:MAG TPA: FAD-dependent oxidoreductase [Streptosporangiaceae bacterium]|jgi:NADPH-dependent 2,4-dienoyl-CoA reductase/sulfur reductase-like enzyme
MVTDEGEGSMAEPAKVVVVGAGLAGLRVAEELRARGYDGAVTLIGAEDRPPYDRPPLSKKVMTGEFDDTGLRADLESLSVTLRLGERALELTDRVLRTDAAEYEWDALVAATGACPVRLPGDGPQHVLRTASDALALRALLTPATRLAIVGAGWIGAELATAAAIRGCEVTVLEAADTPLAAAIGADVGGKTIAWYAEAGVHLRLNESVAAIEPGGIALRDGGWVPADVVVTAVGVRPAVSWLAGSGVRIDNGVAADGQLRTSVPGVFAAGDCASFWSARYQRQLRFEHWDVALHAPEVVAANVLGGSAEYDPVPYFWSEQFGRMVQYVGWHGVADRLIWRGRPAEAKWAACWLAGDRLVAALTVGLPRDLLQARRLIEAGGLVDPAKLADPGIAVRDSGIAG